MGRLVRVCAPCSLLVLLGALSLGYGLRLGDTALGIAAVLGGLALVIAGPVLAAVGLKRVLVDDVYLALRSNGVLWKDGAGETFVPWDSLARADVLAADDGLSLREAGTGRELLIRERFVGIESAALAKRIGHLRLRVLHGLERPPAAVADAAIAP